MTNTTLYLKKGSRLALPIIFAFFLVISGVGVYFLFPMFQSAPSISGGGSLNLVLPGLAVLMTGMMLLMILLFGYMALYFWNYRLEFGETHLHLRSIYHPIQYPSFRCAYQDIVSVERGRLRGVLAVVTRDGKVHPLGAEGFEGGAARLLAELSHHVPAGIIAPDLPASLKQYRNFDRIYLVMIIAYFLVTMVVLVVTFGSLFRTAGLDFIRSRVGWETALQPGFLSRIECYSLDQDGSPWVAVGAGFNDKYSVVHVTPDGAQTWNLPPEARQLSNIGPYGVARDGAGQPWIAFKQGILHWNGETWDKISTIQPGSPGQPISSFDTWIWATAGYMGEGDSLYRLDLASGITYTVPYPESAFLAKMKPSGIHILPNNDLLVSFYNDNEHRAYRLQEDGWQEPGEVIEQPAPKLFISDLTLDSTGQIWALSSRYDNEAWIGKLDSMTEKWDWHRLPPFDDAVADQWVDYRNIQVDNLGRVWIEGYEHGENYINFVAVFELTLDDRVNEIVRYTTDNSNYQQGLSDTGLRFGPDGRMWSADDTLTWIDSNAPELPQPLPAWVDIVSSLKVAWIWNVVYLVVGMIYFFTAILYSIFQVSMLYRMKTRKVDNKTPASKS